ncbi:hypothetical protein DPQ33_16285 [Oceanidesulfovibrio indonesiensis]|uniref:Uncharacterized protein n=1 Tax=Oceanidesulfovibrio indonesiensis TaxID=54767 RepID=A0A7M3MAX5_9BACT|nr:hypothetical protein [Oceanidesulfovibrio indonesiensis]TVM15045.1 hypothetical protein DPQ33_16285 [Oceanidesulfovibrio indonesiensis]
MSKDNIWFKNAAQIHRYLTCEVGDEYIYGDREVAAKESGLVFRVAQKTIYNHIDAALLKSRRGAGGFAKRTVDQYAKRELGDKVQVGTKGELPEPEESEGETELARSRRTMADAEVKEVDAQLKRIKLQEKLGEIIPLHQVERELGERQQAWKLYMTSFMRDHKSEIISAFGGDLDVAKEIIALVGGDEEKAEALSGWMFARSPVLLDLFRKRIVDGLNTFAMGEWFTDDLQEAWEKWDAARKEKEAETMALLIELVDGDSEQASAAMSRFEVSPKGDAAC